MKSEEEPVELGEDWQLEPEADDITDSESVSDLTAPSSDGLSIFSPVALSEGDHWANLIRASIANGGRHGRFKISVYWLRVTLARLEGRNADDEIIYGEEDSVPPERNSALGSALQGPSQA